MKTQMMLLIVIGIVSCSTLSADPLFVYNAGFEELEVADGATVTEAFSPYWPCTGYVQTTDPLDTNLLQPTEGENYLYILSGAALYQAAWTIEDNTIYTLTVDMSTSANYAPAYAWSWIGLFANDHGNNLALNQLGDPAGNNTEILTDQFSEFSVSWDSTGSSWVGQTLLINLQSDRVFYDNVRLDATLVPEPATISLLGLSGLALLRKRGK